MSALLRTHQAYHPRCFNDYSQYQQWRASALLAKPAGSDYCTDCTPVFQAEMILQSRCAFTRTTFHVDCDGITEGRRPESQRLVLQKKRVGR
jgi:hypothetical protein